MDRKGRALRRTFGERHNFSGVVRTVVSCAVLYGVAGVVRKAAKTGEPASSRVTVAASASVLSKTALPVGDTRVGVEARLLNATQRRRVVARLSTSGLLTWAPAVLTAQVVSAAAVVVQGGASVGGTPGVGQRLISAPVCPPEPQFGTVQLTPQPFAQPVRPVPQRLQPLGAKAARF